MDSSSDSESVPERFFAGYEELVMEEGGSDLDLDMAMDYDRLVEEEGLQYTLKSVPLGSRLEPFAQTIGFVEKILLLQPLDARTIVDVDTLVVGADLQVLGKVLEVFGPVEAPMYSVICHQEHLERVQPGLVVHYLPDQASIVQTAQLRAQKCTDADEGEQGDDFYSDDEQEAAARKTRKPKRRVADLEPGEIDE